MSTDRPAFPLSDPWFACWRDAFGDPTYRIWRARDGSVRLPHVRQSRVVAGLRLDVVKSATNLQTVRFDLLTDGQTTDAPTVEPDFAEALLADTGADVLELDFLAPDATVLCALRSAACRLPTTLEPIVRSPFVDCRGSFDDWLATRSYRRNWLRKERRALGALTMTSRLVTEPGEVEAVLDEVLAVDQRTWKADVGGALRQDPAMTRFYLDLARAAAGAGALHLYLLLHRGRIVAFEYDLRANGALYVLKKGYLPEHHQASPGQVLTLRVLRDVFADPDLQRYDMLGGTPKPDPTKTAYATDEEWLYRARAFAPTARGRLAHLAYRSGYRLKQTARPLWLWYKTSPLARRRRRSV